MLDDALVPIEDVIVPRKRMREANHIEELAASIDKNTLLHPITLRRDGKDLILVAGRRRLEAVKLLGRDRIWATILDIDETQALLAEIDENLQREELTALQRANHMKERKNVWESLHPETKHGGAPGNKGGGRGKAPKPKDESITPPIKDGIIPSLIPAPSSSPAPSVLPIEQPESFVNEVAKKTKKSPSTVEQDIRIGEGLCRQAKELLEGTPVEDRKVDLLSIARLDHTEQVAIAQLIHDGEATTFQRAKKLLEAAAIRAEPKPLPSGPFRVIVVDPPWHYEKRNDDSSKRENTSYATMTIDEIKNMDIAAISERDAILWLWITNSHLPEAFAIIKAWGFTYKTMLTWDKVRIGMGDWLRGQTEHCLMCVRGRPNVILTGQTTLIRETSKKHSAKPEKFYRLVESLCAGSKVELFARKAREGWEQWGYEAKYEEEDDLLATSKGLEDIEANGSVPWEQVKSDLGL
jgi:N6-adenosine-specific RNA methylase IME4